MNSLDFMISHLAQKCINDFVEQSENKIKPKIKLSLKYLKKKHKIQYIKKIIKKNNINICITKY